MDAGHHGHPPTRLCDTSDAALWPTQPVQLARGRQPRDALAKTVTYNVSSLDEFETSLREYLNNPPDQPEHTEAQLSFFIGTTFLVHGTTASSSSTATATATSKRPAQEPAPQPSPQRRQQQPAHHGLPPSYGRPSHAYQSAPDPAAALTLSGFTPIADAARNAEHKVTLSIPDALAPTPDPKEKMRKQRAIAKCCVDSIQRVDGYRYSFHNCWNSREDDSFRFSYYCNDSLLNKDRAANGKGAKLGKRATKPVYDCKGVLSIKFSATKKSLDVFYKHVPIHGTYEERAPPPRKDSKRRKFLEVHDPDALERIATRPNRSKTGSEDPESPFASKKKRSKTETRSLSNTSIESELRTQSLHSLLELICVDPVAPPEPELAKPPPPLPPCQVVQDPPALQAQVQSQPAQPRKRPRNSCDVCKTKKTKCDGARPVCSTCFEKKRQCGYSDSANGNDGGKANEPSEILQQAQAARNEMTELEKMRKELEDAKARIQQLESEKRTVPDTIHTPQIRSLPQSQPQPKPKPHQRPHNPHTQSQPHIPQQRQQPNHRQQLQQMNQNGQRALGSPQQIGYKIDNQPLQQHIQAAAQNFFNTHATQSPYGAMNRSLAQNPLSAQNSQSQSQPQSQTSHQMHANETGLASTATSVDANHPYARGDYSWPPPAAYYGYQSAQQPQQPGQQGQQSGQQGQHPPPPAPPLPTQQQQQEQWAAARSSGVFR